MKRLRILPGAAGIIALTATIGFIDGSRENEAEILSRDRVTLVSAQAHIAAVGVSPDKRPDIKPDSAAYLVEIKRGETSANVLVDATTGQILFS